MTPVTSRTPVTLHVSPGYGRRINRLFLAPLALMALVAVGSFALVPAGRLVPLPFSDTRIPTGAGLTMGVAGLVSLMLVVAAATLRAHARRLARAPWLTVSMSGIELPHHDVTLAWDDITAIVPRQAPFTTPQLTLLLRPDWSRRRATRSDARHRSGLTAWFAASSIPVITDRRLGLPVLALAPQAVGMTPAELGALLEPYRVAAVRGAPAA